MNFIEYADEEMLAMNLANRLAGELKTALNAQGDRVLLAVAGGETPGPVYDSLCAADLDWERVDIVPTDERWRPEAHLRSNARMLRARLLVDKAARARFLSLYRAVEQPEDALDEIGASLAPVLPITLLLLGMGEDMHIASLFPGADGLEAALSEDAPPVCALRGGNADEPRVSLTAPLLRGALSTHIVLTGSRKRAALERAVGRKIEDAPVNLVMEQAVFHWAA